MKVVPLGDKVVVKRLAAEEVTSGGIVLPVVDTEHLVRHRRRGRQQ